MRLRNKKGSLMSDLDDFIAEELRDPWSEICAEVAVLNALAGRLAALHRAMRARRGRRW